MPAASVARLLVIDMGMETSHICRSCGTRFTVHRGGSRKGEVLHCERCGTRLWLLREHVQDLYLRYHRTPVLAYTLDSQGRRVQYIDPVAARDRAEYQAAVEGRLRRCPCGGRFRYGAEPRCPGCLSTEEMWDVDEAAGRANFD